MRGKPLDIVLDHLKEMYVIHLWTSLPIVSNPNAHRHQVTQPVVEEDYIVNPLAVSALQPVFSIPPPPGVSLYSCSSCRQSGERSKVRFYEKDVISHVKNS